MSKKVKVFENVEESLPKHCIDASVILYYLDTEQKLFGDSKNYHTDKGASRAYIVKVGTKYKGLLSIITLGEIIKTILDKHPEKYREYTDALQKLIQERKIGFMAYDPKSIVEFISEEVDSVEELKKFDVERTDLQLLMLSIEKAKKGDVQCLVLVDEFQRDVKLVKYLREEYGLGLHHPIEFVNKKDGI